MNLQKKQDNQPRLTEQQYRSVELDSYSSLKVFMTDPHKFYRQFILKDMKREQPSKDMILGTLVHCLLANIEGEFDEKFLISVVGEIDPSKSHGEHFASKIWELMEASINDEGEQTRTFQSIAEEAFQLSKYDRNGEEVRFKKKDIGYALEKFAGSNNELWMNQKRNAQGKILVTVDDITSAERIVNELKTWEGTRDIFNRTNDDRYEVHNELPIMFEYGGMKLKMMADKTIIDHQEKTIEPYDTKITWQVIGFSYKYLEDCYYLQGAVYNSGLKHWIEVQRPELADYTVIPMQFIPAHSANFYKPLIYPMSQQDLQMALQGFKTPNGKKYTGLDEVVRNLNWSLETGNFMITEEDYKNNSRKSLSIQYQ